MPKPRFTLKVIGLAVLVFCVYLAGYRNGYNKSLLEAKASAKAVMDQNFDHLMKAGEAYRKLELTAIREE